MLKSKRNLWLTCGFCGLLSFAACSVPKRIEHRYGDKRDYVEEVLPYDLASVKRTIEAELPTSWRHSFLVRHDSDSFPGDWDLAAPEINPQNPALLRYVGLPLEQRAHDYILQPGDDEWWESEYFWNDRPAKFQSRFLLHLTEVDKKQTKVEIISAYVKIWVGTTWGGHGLPQTVYDQRWVEPTTKDRLDVLELLKRLLRASHTKAL